MKSLWSVTFFDILLSLLILSTFFAFARYVIRNDYIVYSENDLVVETIPEQIKQVIEKGL